MERLAWAGAVVSCLCGWLKARGAPDCTEGTINHYSMALLPAFPEEDLEDAHCVYAVHGTLCMKAGEVVCVCLCSFLNEFPSQCQE